MKPLYLGVIEVAGNTPRTLVAPVFATPGLLLIPSAASGFNFIQVQTYIWPPLWSWAAHAFDELPLFFHPLLFKLIHSPLLEFSFPLLKFPFRLFLTRTLDTICVSLLCLVQDVAGMIILFETAACETGGFMAASKDGRVAATHNETVEL